ncbi:MAG TPA: response regulator, partial [Acholeplasma sp.]|nr:response regulator [Acholeplasma sp.]
MNTYKVAIVDDEQDVRERLESMILKSPTVFELMGVYENGIDAFDGVSGNQIDLLITDIKIPYIDGIELSRKLKQTDPFLKIIIITGYDEFDYAKQAIELEVVGFISKPISQSELDKTLKKAHDKISLAYNINSSLSELSEFREKNLPILIENDLCLLLQMDKPSTGFLNKLSKEGVHLKFNYLAIGVFDFDVIDDKTDFDKADLAFLTMKNQLEQAFKKYDFEFFKRSQQFVLILKSLLPFTNVEILRFLDTEIKRIKRYLNLSLSVGISKAFNLEGSFKANFKEARLALEQRRLLGSNQVFFSSDMKTCQTAELIDKDVYKGLSYLVKYEPVQAVKLEFLNIFSKLTEGVYHYTLTEILNTIISSCDEPSEFIKHDININLVHMELLEIKTKEAALNYFMNLVQIVKKINDSHQTDVVGKNLNRILKFIESNYNDQNISLEMASE